MTLPITRQQAADMADAHAEGLHADLPREFCPECEDRDLKEYPYSEIYDGRDGSIEQTDKDRELTRGTGWEDA